MESPPIQLSTLYEDTSSTIPLVFVLSSGSDPMSSFLRFAKEKNYMERYVNLILVQLYLLTPPQNSCYFTWSRTRSSSGKIDFKCNRQWRLGLLTGI